MTTGKNIIWKRGEIAPKEQFLLFSKIFSVYLYFQESNYIILFICEMWLFDLSFFLNSANLICRDTDISKYFRESLGLRDNESRQYLCVRASHQDITCEMIYDIDRPLLFSKSPCRFTTRAFRKKNKIK